MNPEAERRGFTLVEVLLAIAILGILSGIVAATFHTAVTAWRAGTTVADAIHHADAVMEQVVMGLRSAYYPETAAPLDAYGFTHVDGGEMPEAADTICWVKLGSALVGEDLPYAGVPHRVELSVRGDEAPDGPGLYVRSWRLDGQPEDFDPEMVEPLLLSRQVTALDCRMLDPAKRETSVAEDEAWMDDWETTNRIPEQVRIAIAVGADSVREDPPVFERHVAIPLAALSWNPTVTGGSGGTTRRSRPSRRTVRDAGASPSVRRRP